MSLEFSNAPTPANLTRSQKEVLRQFAHGETLDCASLIHTLGLTRSTVTNALKQLLKAGLIDEVRATTTPKNSPGRPATCYRARLPEGLVGGITVGRRHITVGLADTDGTFLGSDEKELNGCHQAERIAALGNQMLETLVQQHLGSTKRLLSIGLGLPGPIDSNSQLITARSVLPEWAGVDYSRLVKKHFAVETRILNDATLGLIGESTHGAAVGLENVMYLKVSTGIGAGLLTLGQVYMGNQGTVGEIGHIQADPRGQICHCGCRGCLETVASLPAVLSSLELVLGPKPTPEELFEKYRQGNRPVIRATLEAAKAIGHAVAMVCNLLNPQMVILAGQMPSVGHEFVDEVRDVVRNTAMAPNGETVTIVPPQLRNQSEIYGALTMARQCLYPAAQEPR